MHGGVGKPVGVVVEEILGIDEQLREAYGLDGIEKRYEEHRKGPRLVLDKENPVNHVEGRKIDERGQYEGLTVKYN